MRLKALYTVPELARMAGMSERTMHRWLLRQRVQIIRCGGGVRVPLYAFREAFPDVWQAIQFAQEMQPGTCEACGAALSP